jgi:hypothetical protein
VFVAAGFLLMCAAVVGFAFPDLRNANLRKRPASEPLKAAASR